MILGGKMAKSRKTIRTFLPTYQTDRRQWRRDILDALQGKLRGLKTFAKTPLIGNDNQIYRVLIEKQQPPKRYPFAGGRLLIRPYQRHHWPLQATKGNKFVKLRTPLA